MHNLTKELGNTCVYYSSFEYLPLYCANTDVTFVYFKKRFKFEVVILTVVLSRLYLRSPVGASPLPELVSQCASQTQVYSTLGNRRPVPCKINSSLTTSDSVWHTKKNNLTCLTSRKTNPYTTACINCYSRNKCEFTSNNVCSNCSFCSMFSILFNILVKPAQYQLLGNKLSSKSQIIFGFLTHANKFSKQRWSNLLDSVLQCTRAMFPVLLNATQSQT